MKNVSKYGYTHIGGRKKNEDSGTIHIYGKNIVAVIADGLGGQGDGKAASELAVQSLSKCGTKDRIPKESEISAAFRTANEAILEKQKNSFHMKTTAVYLCIREESAVWAHIGDSRLYHFRDDILCHYTLDHSLSQIAVAMGEIKREEIPGHSKRSQLLRALGCAGDEAEVHETVRLKKGRHAFLLCTDGFWEYLTEEEILKDLQQADSAEIWVRKMRKRLNGRCGEDNDNNTAAAVVFEV